MRPSTEGPSRMPASSCPITDGWPMRLMASPIRRPTTISVMSCARKMTSDGLCAAPSAASATFGASVRTLASASNASREGNGGGARVMMVPAPSQSAQLGIVPPCIGCVGGLSRLWSAQRTERIAPHLGDRLGNLVCNLWPMGSHLREFGFGDQIAQPGLEARTIARQGSPRRHAGPIIDPEIEKSEIGEPRCERHQVDVGETWTRTQDPRPGFAERSLQHLERPLVGRNPVHPESRTRAELVGRHEAVATTRVAYVAEAPGADVLRHIAHALTKHRREADLGHALEQALVNHLAPQSHPRSQPWIGGYQPRLRKRVVEILADQRRFDDRLAVMHERRHDPFGIELQVFGVVLLGLEQIDLDGSPVEPLGAHRNAHFLATH